tara:strand:+ start:278 stop:1021 length:744 start_codon:yes stop_codon:yes gene_type:complete
MINKRLIQLRKRIRLNRKIIVDKVLVDHSTDICIVCGTSAELTKEHVVPKWVFENNQKKYFVTGVNGISQSYSKTTLPACDECNSNILGFLERYIEQLFRHINLSKDLFSDSEKQKIILWLEILDYKFQALDLRRSFKKAKNAPYIKFLADTPIAIMQRIKLSPSKVFSMYRNSLKRLEIADKSKYLNSLIVFSTTNDNYHFFHQSGEFIFIELPQHRVAIFYHIDKIFEAEIDAYESAMKTINKVY